MPRHAVGRGAQAKLRRGSKRAFFACVGEAGSAGSELQNLIDPIEPLPPSVGALVFLGFLSSGSTSKKFSRYRAAKTASEQDLRIPARRKPPHRPEKSVPPCSLRPRGSSTQIFPAKKGRKISGPCEDPLSSAARGGLPIGR